MRKELTEEQKDLAVRCAHDMAFYYTSDPDAIGHDEGMEIGVMIAARALLGDRLLGKQWAELVWEHANEIHDKELDYDSDDELFGDDPDLRAAYLHDIGDDSAACRVWLSS